MKGVKFEKLSKGDEKEKSEINDAIKEQKEVNRIQTKVTQKKKRKNKGKHLKN